MLILDKSAALLYITHHDQVIALILVQIVCHIYVLDLWYCENSSDFDVKEELILCVLEAHYFC
jgi:hypothetical protein